MGKKEQYEPHEILAEQMVANLYIQFNTNLSSNYYVLCITMYLGSLLGLVKLVNSCQGKARSERCGYLWHFHQ